MGLVFIPVYVPFLTARGVTAGDVLTLQAIMGLAVVVLEIPTGYLCDVIGRRRTIVIGAALNLAGMTGFATMHSFAGYAAVQLVLAAGLSLVSGADIALIYDVLDLTQAGRDKRRRALANYQLAQALGEAAASLLGGALASWSLAAVGWTAAAEAALPLLIAVALPGRNGRRLAATPTDIPRAFREVFADTGRILLFANIVVWSLSTFIAVWLLQPYWQAQNVGLRWFGVLWAATLVTVGLASRAAPALTSGIGQRGAVLVLTACPVLAYAGMAWLSGAAGIACGFLFYLSRGLNAVTLNEAFNHQVSSRLRATTNSLTSGVFNLSFAVCGPLVGLVVDRGGIVLSLKLLAGAFLMAFLLLALPLLRRLPGAMDRATKEP